MYKVIREDGNVIVRDLTGQRADKIFDPDAHIVARDQYGEKYAVNLGASDDTKVLNVLLQNNLIDD
jgi:hypothetical protein